MTEALDEVKFLERERTDRQLVELAILLYNYDESPQDRVSARLAWCRAVVAIWARIPKSGDD